MHICSLSRILASSLCTSVNFNGLYHGLFQVAITTDGWTSRATESYVTITVTFINVDWKLVNFVLQTRPLPESHTAENIAEVIEYAVKEWKLPTGLGGTVPPVISDNAANMIKAGKVLGCTIHIGCLAHTLNLAVQKALKVKSVSQLLARVRSIVSFFHRSCVATAVLKSKAQLLGLPNHKLKTDVCTRWNSAFEMLNRFLELQAAVVATLTSKEMMHMKDKTLHSISDQNLTLAQEVSVMLKPVKEITTMLCTESLPTVSVIMPLHFKLTNKILQPNEDDLHAIVEMKQIMRADLTQRYLDKTELLNMTSAIDPRFKQLPYLSDDDRFAVYNHLTEEAIRVSAVVPAVVKVKTKKSEPVTMTKATVSQPPLPSLPTDMLEDQSDEIVCDTAPAIKQESQIVATPKSVLNDILGEVFIARVEAPKSSQELAQMEVIQYKSEPPVSLNDNPLQWWKQRELRFPFLSKLAKCLLCIPATSVPSERVFSTAGDILTAQRASLKAKHVDKLIFLKKNWK
ncbi:E3 SUMO-protein ligase ZBED1-like [Mercenaria mercenaria]|uniref:E3 SUMO-protein ligase ZBED1-like n=1 Tax=Mercenaria mercenaria TaxID=6596 RepID=UPI001E1DF359|nr:E3 SUMO-protein ligase ZBED1-like [Mercenaria mercenaria]